MAVHALDIRGDWFRNIVGTHHFQGVYNRLPLGPVKVTLGYIPNDANPHAIGAFVDDLQVGWLGTHRDLGPDDPWVRFVTALESAGRRPRFNGRAIRGAACIDRNGLVWPMPSDDPFKFVKSADAVASTNGCGENLLLIAALQTNSLPAATSLLGNLTETASPIPAADEPVAPAVDQPEPAPRNRQKTMIIISIAACLLAVIIMATTFVTESTSTAPTVMTSNYPSTSRAATPDSTSPALAKLATIPVKGRAPKANYDRALFGSPWTDDVTVEGGHNGCDTRNDILRRDLNGAGYKPGRKTCIVLSGTLNDPYTGEIILYQRGPSTSRQIQIDHIVPLLDAWQKGAQNWDYMTRRNFANDPINLQATTATVNDHKGSSDAATWLPPNKTYRCTYVTRIVDVKARYGLWVTQAEHDELARILNAC